jgi:hypothetical protein
MKMPDRKTLTNLPGQALYVASAVGVALMVGAVWGVTRLFRRGPKPD